MKEFTSIVITVNSDSSQNPTCKLNTVEDIKIYSACNKVYSAGII